MKLFKHEDPKVEPVQEKVEPEQGPTTPEPVQTAVEPAVETPVFGRMTEHEDDGDLVIVATMAGLDPDKDVEVSVSDGVLRIEAHHREEDTTDDDGHIWRALRYSRILRTLPLPAGVSEADIKASYKDGTLEVRVPAATVAAETPTASKVPITTA